jgi:hypothetical protein
METGTLTAKGGCGPSHWEACARKDQLLSFGLSLDSCREQAGDGLLLPHFRLWAPCAYCASLPATTLPVVMWFWAQDPSKQRQFSRGGN